VRTSGNEGTSTTDSRDASTAVTLATSNSNFSKEDRNIMTAHESNRRNENNNRTTNTV
jgi:hypothetical protein